MKSETPKPATLEVASGYKIAAHRERVLAYLRGEPVYPVSLELDLTSRCSRNCRDCPSTRASVHWELSENFIERLFSVLGGNVPGLLLTGGEPTISALFAPTLALARQRGFRDIAVVTNGSHLDNEEVCTALLAHASTIRVSLYDWEEEVFSGAESILQHLQTLRQRIEGSQSPLRIGVSALTSTRRLKKLRRLVQKAVGAGVHWIYFHPRCRHWDQGRPQPEEQAGVLDEIGRLQEEFSEQIEIDVSTQRYLDFPLHFAAYHAAHFLMVVGADRKNYLGAEVKYHPDFVIDDLGNGFDNDFLWDNIRLQQIDAQSSDKYRALGSRHRGVLYNDFIERLKCKDREAERILDSRPHFRYPHIL
ncbi:MAG: radical SAM protein [Candidatus Aminicenantes bacterium]|nr:radical SAM protein [Candidatus Aminicenantes bacterium]